MLIALFVLISQRKVTLGRSLQLTYMLTCLQGGTRSGWKGRSWAAGRRWSRH